jgi:hypothetical protein
MRSILRCVRVGGIPRIISLATPILCSYVSISATPSDDESTVKASWETRTQSPRNRIPTTK